MRHPRDFTGGAFQKLTLWPDQGGKADSSLHLDATRTLGPPPFIRSRLVGSNLCSHPMSTSGDHKHGQAQTTLGGQVWPLRPGSAASSTQAIAFTGRRCGRSWDAPLMTHKYRGCIIVLSINKSVEPNEEQKVLTSGFDQGFTVNTSKRVFRGIW
jgi:hypothetical protein